MDNLKDIFLGLSWLQVAISIRLWRQRLVVEIEDNEVKKEYDDSVNIQVVIGNQVLYKPENEGLGGKY